MFENYLQAFGAAKKNIIKYQVWKQELYKWNKYFRI